MLKCPKEVGPEGQSQRSDEELSSLCLVWATDKSISLGHLNRGGRSHGGLGMGRGDVQVLCLQRVLGPLTRMG